MKTADIPHDMNYEMGEDLKEKPTNLEEMKEGIDFIHSALMKESDELKKASMLSLIGVYSRIVGELTESESYLSEAIEIFKKHQKAKPLTYLRLRLATTLHWKEKYSSAEKIFLEIIQSQTPESKHYLDYACQHMGKCKFDQKLYKEALNYFMQALDLRLVKGDMELIRSTEMAIEKVRPLIQE